MKNRHESAEKAKPKHLLCVLLLLFFEVIKVRPLLEMYSTNAIAVGESN